MNNRLSLLLLCLLALLAPAPAAANTRAGAPRFFRETGHTLAYSFRDFHERNGGLPIFGLPLTEVFLENNLPVQYFERARFEWHPTIAAVQVGHLGRWAAVGREGEPAFQPLAGPPAEGAFFPETGHSLGGDFLAFWQRNGGLAAFGLPISEPFDELNSQDGQPYTVQYFERARFELHPEAPPRYRVQLGHLGRHYLAANPAPEWAALPVSSADAAWASLRPTRVVIARIGVDTEVISAGFSLGAWDVPRSSAVNYWPVSGYPGVGGNIVIAGHVGYRGIIFSRLPEVAPGDTVAVTAGGREHSYVVREVLTLLPDQVWVMYPTTTETLTLITCVPIGVYSHRLIVRAEPVG